MCVHNLWSLIKAVFQLSVFHTFHQWRITSSVTCRLSKIHGPSDCIQTAKDSVTSRGKNEEKLKTVFGDFKGSVLMNEEK